MKKSSLRIDMTPMVDLGFLLITFFVITAELTEPRAMNLVMPKDNGRVRDELGELYALTVLLDGEKNYCYEKSWEDALRQHNIRQVTTVALRQIIMQKQKALDDTTRYAEGRNGLMLLIKPSPQANYETIVDALDEAVINDVRKYAIIKLSEEERNWLLQNR